MPIPKIIVFLEQDQHGQVPEDSSEAKIIKQFTHQGFTPMVDALNSGNYDWYRRNFASNANHRFYLAEYGKRCIEFTYEDLPEPDGEGEVLYMPDFVIVFDVDVEVPLEVWKDVRVYLCYNILEIPASGKTAESSDDHYRQEHISRALDFMEKPTIAPLILAPSTDMVTASGGKGQQQQQQQHYGFRYYHLEPRDIMIYEVIKPHTDNPYTTLTPEYSKKGHLPFFSSLFICNSWGVCNADLSFLHQIWRYLNMEGDCDLEQLYKDRTASCYPSPSTVPEPEPMVFRRTLEEIVERYASGLVERGSKKSRRDEAMARLSRCSN